MIEDTEVRELFLGFQDKLLEYWDDRDINSLPTHFLRGSTKHFGKKASQKYCEYNHLLQVTYNIIPKYCFNCYKIQISPKTVVEFFKLMIVFEKIKLPNDNLRKCIVERRPTIGGTYKGLIYSKSLKDVKKIFKTIQEIVLNEIAENISVTVKRGCSEFSQVYPEFGKIDKNLKPIMRYREKWQTYEEFAERNIPFKPDFEPTDHNQPYFTINDAAVMLSWLKYAATIGDSTYKLITNKPIPKLNGLERP